MTNKIASSMYIAALLVSLISCTTTTIDVVPVTPHAAPVRHCVIGTITLESIYSYTNDQQELKSIIISAGKEHGFIFEESPPVVHSANQYTINFLLREKSYVKGFETILSTAILADIYSPAGEILYRISWLHDGEESLTSLVFLREALSGMFEALSQQAMNPETEES